MFGAMIVIVYHHLWCDKGLAGPCSHYTDREPEAEREGGACIIAPGGGKQNPDSSPASTFDSGLPSHTQETGHTALVASAGGSPGPGAG